MTRYEQAVEIARICNLDSSMIKQSSINEMKWKAKRPKNSSLNVEKAESTLDKKPMNFRDGMSFFASEIKNH
jgi:dTDP-4-dehydrorhamnose reductase